MAPRFAASPRATLETSAPSARALRLHPRGAAFLGRVRADILNRPRTLASRRVIEGPAIERSSGERRQARGGGVPGQGNLGAEVPRDGYTVLASYGHVRDLVQKNGGVKPEDDFSMLWAEKARDGVVRDIVKNAKGAAELLLATDPDREGEAISGTSSSCSARRGCWGPPHPSP